MVGFRFSQEIEQERYEGSLLQGPGDGLVAGTVAAAATAIDEHDDAARIGGYR